MRQFDFISRLTEKDYIFSNYLYPIITGLTLAYFISSIINASLYSFKIGHPLTSHSIKNIEINRNSYVRNIVDKNVFRLKTGLEDGQATTNNGKVQSVSEPLSGLELVGTVVGKDPLAILKKDTILYIVKKGDKIKGYKLKEITFKGITLAGAKGDIILKFPENIRPNNNKKTTSILKPAPQQNKEPELEKVVIKREEVLSTSQDLNKLLTTVRIAPFYKKDEFLGYRINMLKRDSFLYRLGVRAGDILQRINGEEINSPDKAIEMLSKLDDITAINVDLLRRGTRKTLFIEIED